MAIKFVDIEPGDEPKRTAAPKVQPRIEDAPAAEAGTKLPLAKPEAKQKGRKKPLR